MPKTGGAKDFNSELPTTAGESEPFSGSSNLQPPTAARSQMFPLQKAPRKRKPKAGGAEEFNSDIPSTAARSEPFSGSSNLQPPTAARSQTFPVQEAPRKRKPKAGKGQLLSSTSFNSGPARGSKARRQISCDLEPPREARTSTWPLGGTPREYAWARTPLLTEMQRAQASREGPCTHAKLPEMSLLEFLQLFKLERYLPRFEEEEIDMRSLPLLSDQDLASLGIKMGPRRLLQKALDISKGLP